MVGRGLSLDRKRINTALDKHLEKTTSPSTSRVFNKDKEKLSVPSELCETGSLKIRRNLHSVCFKSLVQQVIWGVLERTSTMRRWQRTKKVMVLIK